MQLRLSLSAVPFVVLLLCASSCAGSGALRPWGGGDGASASAAEGEEASGALEEEELDEALSGDLEPIPELPDDLPALSEGEHDRIRGQLESFFARPDQELAAQIDGLLIYRGIPPEGEPVPADRVPILLNPHVERWILFFTGKGQPIFEKWLARLPRYQPLFEGILREHGVPTDLVYLAMIESGFSLRAYSRARAVGPWQFMMGTGRHYDLRVDWWVDERRDPVIATHAAARHLRDLHDEFGSWYLAAAAYNAGAGKIRRGLGRYQVSTFWSLLEHPYLRNETRNYVPKLLAAMVLAKAPERWGFVDIEPLEPLTFDTVKVPPSTDLNVVAQATGRPYEEIRDLNPHLRRWFTPPEGGATALRVPKGTGGAFAENFEKLNKGEQNIFLSHTVRKGETLSQLAYMYQTDMWAIKRLNHVGRYLRAGSALKIPVRPGTKPRTPPVQLARTSRMLRDGSLHVPKGQTELLHVVGPGDTLWGVSEHFGVDIKDLRRWNEIPGRSRLFPGDVLSIVLPDDRAGAFASTNRVRVQRDEIDPASAAAVEYRVRRGDTGWAIARKHNVEFQQLQSWNPKVDWRRIKPGDRVTLYLAKGDTN